jgi:hypothetical protein
MMRALDEIFGFAPDGKLEKLHLVGCPNILHEWRQWASHALFRFEHL